MLRLRLRMAVALFNVYCMRPFARDTKVEERDINRQAGTNRYSDPVTSHSLRFKQILVPCGDCEIHNATAVNTSPLYSRYSYIVGARLPTSRPVNHKPDISTEVVCGDYPKKNTCWRGVLSYQPRPESCYYASKRIRGLLHTQ
jgi:hypothetical protein